MTSSDSLRRVFLGSIPETVSESEIRAAGARYGTVTAFHYVASSRGWALLTYSTPEEANAAIMGMNDTRLFSSCQIPIVARIANDKREHSTAGTRPSFSNAPPRSNAAHHATNGSSNVVYPGYGHPPMGVQSTYPLSPIGANAQQPIQQPPEPQQPVPGPPPQATSPWLQYMSADGQPYYYNIHTKLSQWDKPPEFVQPMMPMRSLGTGNVSGTVSGGVMMVPMSSPVGHPSAMGPASQHISAGTQSYLHRAGGINSGNAHQFSYCMQQQTSVGDILGARRFGPPGCNLFIFHIPSEWGNTELYEHFKFFGKIVSARVKTGSDESTRNLGYGFVSYDTPEATVSAIKAMHGFHVGGKWLKVTLKKGEEHLLPPSLQSLYSRGGGSQGVTGNSVAAKRVGSSPTSNNGSTAIGRGPLSSQPNEVPAAAQPVAASGSVYNAAAPQQASMAPTPAHSNSTDVMRTAGGASSMIMTASTQSSNDTTPTASGGPSVPVLALEGTNMVSSQGVQPGSLMSLDNSSSSAGNTLGLVSTPNAIGVSPSPQHVSDLTAGSANGTAVAAAASMQAFAAVTSAPESITTAAAPT